MLNRMPANWSVHGPGSAYARHACFVGVDGFEVDLWRITWYSSWMSLPQEFRLISRIISGSAGLRPSAGRRARRPAGYMPGNFFWISWICASGWSNCTRPACTGVCGTSCPRLSRARPRRCRNAACSGPTHWSADWFRLLTRSSS